MVTLSSLKSAIEIARSSRKENEKPEIVQEDLYTSIFLPLILTEYTLETILHIDDENEESIALIDSVFINFSIQIYASDSAISLMKKYHEVSLNNKKEPMDVRKQPLAYVFIETEREGVVQDLLSPYYMRLIYNIRYDDGKTSNKEKANKFLDNTEDITSILIKALGFEKDRDGYRKWILSQIEDSIIEENDESNLFKAAIKVLDITEFLTGEIVDFLAQEKLHIPKHIWDRKERNKDAETLKKDFLAFLEGKVAAMLKAIQKAERIKPPKIPDLFEGKFVAAMNKITELINGLIEAAKSIAGFVERDLLNIEDSFDTLVGFFSGVWNAIVDLIIGLFSMGKFIAVGFRGLLKVEKSFSKFFDAFTEFLDELWQAITNIEWIEVIKYIFTEVFPELKKFLTEEIPSWLEEIESRIDNVSQFSYDTGYFVFEVAENFLPPLRTLKVGSVSDAFAGIFKKVD